ncbi:N5-carboxyaminoimidazole ribonucleotide synthetase monomer [Synechococcus sp. RS9907]|uniref:5-(carboxyamino)imidazole ribonucleotide synthase n=1 Tax=unclassified Synechococcus TaxID=2626047 RepID=UPI0016478C88|nr:MULTISPECIES: 5-(carboxyamino)imidazole ribonucleotide synthase [unclassified Synechococcus]QNI82434.1 N5-carboxyaminoimidazole ribonucleotide synthetase monomer [Synechococcus sp. RS9907]QNI97403.1 N5-carboxyaminoimidazole ribonucleotide synthetase monomer [Synechococcus sp. RS9902]
MIGVVGGGQLARMLVQAAAQRDVPIAVQTSDAADPAAGLASRLVAADPRDVAGTRELVVGCDGITFENEWVNIDALLPLEQQGVRFQPSLAALSPLVDKLSQRQLLDDLAIPSPPWCPLSLISPAQPALPQGWTFPVMAKASRGGYDGKGTVVLRDIDGLAQLLRAVPADDWLLESWVDYELELALVVSRDQRGRIRHFPLVQTHQHQQVCDWVLAPAPVDPSVAALAYNVAASLMTKLGYVGVLALEFFYGPAGLQVNEIAPRTHNSGHYSIEACTSSQFDQQLCIAAGLPVPDPELKSRGALMVNLLGLDPERHPPLDQRLEALEAMPGLHLHWYGKSPETPGRKLGHVTLLLEGDTLLKRRDEAESALAAIRRIWPLESESQD